MGVQPGPGGLPGRTGVRYGRWRGAREGEERARGEACLFVEPAVERELMVLRQVGCGTALPTCYVFARLLAEIARAPSDPASLPKVTRIHLQDYNKQGMPAPSDAKHAH